MIEGVDVSEGLAAMPPGPALAALLAGIDPAAVANNELLPVLRAQSRQAAHEQARLLAVIAEVSRAKPTFNDREVLRLDHPHQYCADEVRCALSWSRRAAEGETSLAEHVVHHLPFVFEAFMAGEIDKPKARVFSDHLGGLTAAQVHKICAAITPVAGRLTTGQIAARLRRMITAVDPRHYERRYRKGLRDRRVIGYLTDDGTATITTSGLTPAEAAAALERIDTLALAARNAGHPSTLDQIRVDIVAGLLDGTLHQLDRDAMIAHLIAHRSAAAPSGHPDPAPPGGDERQNPNEATGGDTGGQSDDGAPQAGPRSNDGHAEDDSQPGRDIDTTHQDATTTCGWIGSTVAAQGTTAGGGRIGPADATDQDGIAGGGLERVAGPATTPSPAAAQAVPPPSPAGGDDEREDQRVGVEVRVEISTLLGLDEHPGELPGWGPITARHARDTVARQRRAEWRFAVTDDDGRLVFDGLTRRRPPDMDRTGPRGGVVELQIPVTLLEHLAGTGAPAGGPWTTVIADIARRYADRASRDLDAHPTDRFPRAALRRHVQVRDRTCVGPGCRHRAQRCDQDHTVDHDLGGPTIAADLGPLCRHDHGLKHEAGWQLEQPEPGVFLWTSPLGGTYRVQPEPVLPPLPDPEPGPDDPWHDEPAEDDDRSLRLHAPARPPPPSPPTPPTVDPDEPPPF